MVKVLAERHQAIFRDRAAILYGNSAPGLLVTLFAASFLVFSFPPVNDSIFKFVWLGVLYLLLLARAVDALIWRKRYKDSQYDGRKAVTRYVSGTLSTAVMWAIYCICVFQHSDDIESSFIIITMSALAGGASNILSAHKFTAMSYSALLLGPPSIALLLGENSFQNMFGVLGLAYCVTIVVAASKSAHFTTNAIRLKNENAVLVNEMELKVAERTEKIYELSNLDPLTGLFNRTAFMERFSHLLSECRSEQKNLALLFIDLDGFKTVNDTLGHETGDRILRVTAERLESLREDDSALCRWGGDEFLLTHMTADKAKIHALARRLITGISEPYDILGTYHTVSATVGISLFPEHSKNADELIQLADTAMYYSKKQQVASVSLFTEGMRAKLHREQRLKAALAKAIELEQLRLVYQPIVDAEKETVVSFEALLRWTLDDEPVSPSEFITIAEQYGMIIPIGNWVLVQACKTAANWLERDETLPSISVNVSVVQLDHESFIFSLRQALIQSLLPPHKLQIEITESIFACDKERVLQSAEQIKKLGVKIAIDDFGIEYSSLSAIQELAPDALKIDRSFVHKLETGGKIIIEAVIRIAQALNYSIIAEGTETERQVAELRSMGVTNMQGFYFSHPLEESDIEKFLVSAKSLSIKDTNGKY